jgi:hypothetical protein
MFFLGNVATINKRRRHTATPLFVSGNTAIIGRSDSQLLLVATHLMRRNYGLVYFGSKEILEYVPPNRREDVVYFRPADTEYPLGLNVLTDPGAAVDALRSVWNEEWGTLIDGYTYATCSALSDFPSGTILAINRMLLDYHYRKRVLSHVKDIGVRNYWTKEFTTIEPRDLRNQIQSTLNKIRKLINDPLIRNIVGQRTVFKANTRTIFIGDFSDLDDRNGPLLASLALAYLSKLKVPFLLDNPAYGHFTIPHLSPLAITLPYLPDEKSPLRQVVENSNICAFQLGLKDAKALLPNFGKTVKLDDLLDLPPGQAYVKGERISVPEPIGIRRDPTPIINRCRALSPGREVIEARLRRFLS